MTDIILKILIAIYAMGVIAMMILSIGRVILTLLIKKDEALIRRLVEKK